MNRAPCTYPVVTCSLAAASMIFTVANAPALAPARVVCVALFLLSSPGGALVGLLFAEELGAALTTALAVSLSIALGTAIALAMIYLHAWAPTWGVGLLAATTALASGTEISADVRHTRRVQRLRACLESLRI